MALFSPFISRALAPPLDPRGRHGTSVTSLSSIVMPSPAVAILLRNPRDRYYYIPRKPACWPIENGLVIIGRCFDSRLNISATNSFSFSFVALNVQRYVLNNFNFESSGGQIVIYLWPNLIVFVCLLGASKDAQMFFQKTLLVFSVITVLCLVAFYQSALSSKICGRFFDPLIMLGQMDVRSMTVQQLVEYLYWTNRYRPK